MLRSSLTRARRVVPVLIQPSSSSMRRTTFLRHLARAVVTSLVRNTGPLRKAVASPNDADELAWAVSPHGDPWTPTNFRGAKPTIGMV